MNFIVIKFAETQKGLIMGTKTKIVKKARDAKNGRYVSLDYAEDHPNTTVVETEKVKIRQKPKRK